MTSDEIHELAHRINNALSVVIHNSEMLTAHLADDDPRKQQVNEISEAGYRAATDLRALVPHLLSR